MLVYIYLIHRRNGYVRIVKKPSELNVIITRLPRCGVSEIFGFIKLAHKAIFKSDLKIKHEISYFDVIKFDRPLVKGWNGVIGAEPQRLLDRGYDKVIVVSRSLKGACKSQLDYFRKVQTLEECISLWLEDPAFIPKVRKKWDRLNAVIEDPRLLIISLDQWNYQLHQTYHLILDFLEFPKEGRPHLVPVRRDPEILNAYSDSHEPLDQVPCENIRRIRERVKS